MKKTLLLLLLFANTLIVSAQQDAQFSQYMFNGLYINPAYAGYKEQANIHTFYRSQWTGFEGAPQTMSLAGDMVLNEGNVGLGILLSNDFTGAQSNFSAYANYAYRIQVGDSEFSRLSFGLGAGIVALRTHGAFASHQGGWQAFDDRCGVHHRRAARTGAGAADGLGHS